MLNKYKDAPVKTVLGKDISDVPNFPATIFALDKKDDLLAHCNTQLTSLHAGIKKVFETFDLDGSGFIDSQEL